MLAKVRDFSESASKRAARLLAMARVARQPRDARLAAERRHRGLEQYNKLRACDVAVVSFGKSGRTWLRVMMSRFYQQRFGISQSLLIGFDNYNYRDNRIPKVFFTHDNYTKDYTGNVDNKADYYGKKVVLLVRHPADVAVSQYHQWKFRMRERKKSLNEYPEDGRDVSIFEFVAHERAGLDKVIEFMNLWAAEMERVGEVFILRYEDLRRDTSRTFGSVLAFCGTPGEPHEVEDAVAFASFENMRRLEQSNSFRFSGSRLRARDKDNPESFKTRRGKVGGWRDYFDEAQQREIEAIVDDRLHPIYRYRDTVDAGAALAASA